MVLHPSDDPPLFFTALDAVVHAWSERFDYDADGRIVDSTQGNTGALPRFVFARTREGCIWRFRSDVPPEQILRLAKLAGREPPWTGDTETGHAVPERLEMMRRCLDDTELCPEPERALREWPGGLRAEIWSVF